MNDHGPPYRCIVADPPWMEQGSGSSKRGADRHYPLMTRTQILATILQAPAWQPAADAHLWLWATMNHLPDALWLIDALGFRYVTNATWVKLRSGVKVGAEVRKVATGGGTVEEVVRVALATGLGQYLRGQHEHLLLATRGRGAQVRTDRRNIPSVVVAPRGAHSAKPAAALAMIQDRSLGPRLELFAREPREGWTTWGPVGGHRWVVKECGRVRSGHQRKEDALAWCRLNGAMKPESMELEVGITIEPVGSD